MKTSPPKVEPRDLIVIPEAAPPRRMDTLALVAIVAVLALLAGGGISYAWQQSRVNDREAARVQAVNGRIAADAQVTALEQRSTALDAEVASLEQQLADARRGRQVVEASKAEVRRLLNQTRNDLTAARLQLTQMIGVALADGQHVGRILAVGPSANPARIVVDPGRWLTGKAARRAAIEDGVIQPGQPLPGNHYFRNLTQDWRILRISTTTLVTLHDYRGVRGSTTVTLLAFEKILSSRAAPDEKVRHDPFWITVSGGQVTAIRQQPYP